MLKEWYALISNFSQKIYNARRNILTIKLQLLYSGIDYRKIKLISLLNAFNHKRRSAVLIDGMKKALKALDLKTYLKAYKNCDIADINVNQMIVIRLL